MLCGTDFVQLLRKNARINKLEEFFQICILSEFNVLSGENSNFKSQLSYEHVVSNIGYNTITGKGRTHIFLKMQKRCRPGIPSLKSSDIA